MTKYDALAVALLCALCAGAATDDQKNRPPTLVERAERNCDVVEEHQSDGLPESPAYVLQNADAVFVGSLISSRSRLSQSGYQVLTDHSMKLEKWLFGRSDAPVQGSAIEVTQIGGAVTYGASRIVVRNPNSPPLVEGRTYIIVAMKRAGGLYLYPQATFVLEAGRGRCHARQPGTFKKFCGKETDDLIAALRSR